MKKFLSRLCSIACAALLLCQLNSCKDPAITDKGNSLGFDAINLAHIDTAAIIMNTLAEVPLQASAVTTGVIGSMNDPVFGRTYAGFYAQCLLSTNGAQFDNTPVLDSVVLYMPFINDSSKYGPCRNPIDISVYEVSQYIDPTVIYKSNDAFGVYNQPIGKKTGYVPDLIDSSIVRGYVLAPQIAIRLNNSFGLKLLATDSNSLSSSTMFINYLKGIYVTTSTPTGDGISYINLTSSKISLFYHNSQADTLQFDFPITTYSSTINHFDHQYSGTLAQNAINHPLPTGDKTGYVQSGVGTKVRLKIPALSNLTAMAGARSIGITKAELILPVQVTDTASFPLPQSLTLYRLDDTLGTQLLNSYNKSGTGTLLTRQETNGQPYYAYVFNITEYVQRLLNGYYPNNGFYIEYSYTVRADRAVLLNDPTDPMKMKQSRIKITYTKLQ